MNFLLTLIKFLLFLVILGGGAFFVGREAWLYYGAYQVQSAAGTFDNTRQWQDAVNACSGVGGVSDAAFDGFQLRFLTDEEYALEVRCVNLAPSVKERLKLPVGVKKSTGSSGLFYNFSTKTITGEFTLEFLGRTRVVAADNESVTNTWGSTTQHSAVPASVCQAFGYQCCDPLRYQGVGDPLSSGVTDCRAGCFQACQQRPFLLSFQTDPGGDYETRQVPLYNNGGLVIFTYTFDSVEAGLQNVTIEYGDGTQDTSTLIQGQFTKEYTCPSGQCTFTAVIRATDARGVVSADSRLNTWTFQVQSGNDPSAFVEPAF